jgi:hypothetical protein
VVEVGRHLLASVDLVRRVHERLKLPRPPA